MSDCILDLYEELRTQLPPLPALVSDADARTQWLHAMCQVVQALPTRRQRTAAVIQLADDLVTLRYPALPLAMACAWLCDQFGISEDEMALEEEAHE